MSLFRAIFHELRLKLSGNTNNQVLLSEYYRSGHSTQTSSQIFGNQDGEKSLFHKKYGHPRDTQSLTAPKHFSRRNAWQRPTVRAHVITGVYFHQKSVIYCQGGMISKWCYAWISCCKSGLDPVYLSKLIKLILSIIKAYNLPREV